MARQEANEQFQLTSFLDGANAGYIDQLYARYENDPSSVSGEWQSFFKALQEQPEDVIKAAKGASWKKPHWPIPAIGARSKRSSKRRCRRRPRHRPW
jgi:2-oxoglutarate dehydrogenase E1 component